MGPLPDLETGGYIQGSNKKVVESAGLHLEEDEGWENIQLMGALQGSYKGI